MKQKRNIKSIFVACVLIVIFGFALWYSINQLAKPSSEDSPPAGAIKIQGQMVCLPHRNTKGPQTLECAMGLKDDQGRYFSLKDTDPNYKNISGVGTDKLVEIEGNFIPQEDEKYQSIGVIEVAVLKEVVRSDFEIKNLPPDVLPEQINSKYSANGFIYAFAVQNNANFNLPALQGKNIRWHGVLRSKDNGQTWEKFFTINDPKDQATDRLIKYNPVGGFAQNSQLYIDIANDQGAGSGEGQLIRFSTSDNAESWHQEGCYYLMPEKYYPDYAQGKTDTISPHGIEQSEGCVY